MLECFVGMAVDIPYFIGRIVVCLENPTRLSSFPTWKVLRLGSFYFSFD